MKLEHYISRTALFGANLYTDDGTWKATEMLVSYCWTSEAKKKQNLICCSIGVQNFLTNHSHINSTKLSKLIFIQRATVIMY